MTMPPRVSLRDISEAVGVSVSTVSRALNGSDRVSVLTKQAVAEAAAQLAIAGSANGRTRTQPMIGLTHSHRSSSSATRSLDVILEQVLGGIEVACLQAGYIPYPWQRSSLLLTDEGDPFFKAVSGVIMSGGIVDRAVVESMRARGLPVVIIGGHVPDMGVVSVAADGQRGAYLAVRHLVELGHRRIGLVNGPDQTYTSFEKRAGYLTAIVDANFVPNPDYIRARDGYHGFDAEAGEALTEELLDLPEPPTAIVYAADQMAEAGYRVCHRRELRIPGDISIVGFHDDTPARSARPAMTTIHVDRAQWGQVAAECLLHILGGRPSRGSRLLLPVRLIERESTGPAAGQR